MNFQEPTGVRVFRSGGKDGFGNTRPEASHEIADCWWGSLRSETDDLSNADPRSVKLGLPADADLEGTDSVEFIDPPLPGMKGRWYIDGEVHRLHSPFTGWEPGATATITKGKR